MKTSPESVLHKIAFLEREMEEMDGEIDLTRTNSSVETGFSLLLFLEKLFFLTDLRLSSFSVSKRKRGPE